MNYINTIHVAFRKCLSSCSQFFQVIHTYLFHPFPPSTNLSSSVLLPVPCPVPKETGSEGHMVSVSRAGGSYEGLSWSWATWPLRPTHTQTAAGNVTRRTTEKRGKRGGGFLKEDGTILCLWLTTTFLSFSFWICLLEILNDILGCYLSVTC